MMAWFGADGDTDAEIQRALHISDDADELLALLAALASQGDATPGCELSIASAVWAHEGYAIYPQYVRVLRERLRAAAIQVNFERADEAREAINAWVEEKTRHTISGLLRPGALPKAVRLLLVNAVYFKGAWQAPFKEEETRDQPFYRLNKPPVRVPLMRRCGPRRVVDDDRESFRALAIPYAGYSIEMVILLPREVGGLPHLERQLNAELLRDLLKRVRRAPASDIEVFLPRFRFDATSELAGALKRLGITRAFEPDLADFSGITPDPEGLALSAVLHKARIQVDEEGTVAAAATALPMVDGSAGPPPTFRADHPFLFLIHDTISGSVLFLGRLLDPS
jgi:serpin B